MTTRKTIRPVTLRRVIEICSLASKNEEIDCPIVSERLAVSPSRAEEIVLEVEKMGLLVRLDKRFMASSKTAEFLEFYENEQWERIHEYFLSNYQFYKDFIIVLEAHITDQRGMSMNEIKDESAIHQLSLNQTAIEVLSDWCDRLGTIQRNLYTRRLYAVRTEIELETFKNALTACYRKLSSYRGQKGIFVEIPTIREELCEQLKITRKVFDVTLRIIYSENVGKIELSGAPIVTLAKKSPLSEKRIRRDGKAVILSPKYEIKKEREGLSVSQKTYYYMAIHGEI